MRKETKPKRCQGCEVEFVPGKPWGTFCTRKCRIRYREQQRLVAELEARPLVACPTCGKDFKPTKSFQHFCTRRCQETQVRRGRKPTKTAQWYVTRMWHNMLRRTRSNKGCYETVEVLMTKAEFSAWARPLVAEFMSEFPERSPSVDRIDPKGHYELSNIRIISSAENSFRALLGKAYHEGGLDSLVKSLKDLCETERIEVSILADAMVGVR